MGLGNTDPNAYIAECAEGKTTDVETTTETKIEESAEDNAKEE